MAVPNTFSPNTQIKSAEVNANFAHLSGYAEAEHSPTGLHTDYLVWDGWSPAGETWTYASATSFTISGVDRTSRYTKGTKIKLTQTSAKYFVVASSAFSTNTTVTVIPSSDYTIANAAITSPYYSYAESPQGFPDWFVYTPTRDVAGGTAPTWTTIDVSRWRVTGKEITVELNYHNASGGTAGSGAAEYLVSMPVEMPATMYSLAHSIVGYSKVRGSTASGLGSVRPRGSQSTVGFIDATGSAAVTGTALNTSDRTLYAKIQYGF